MPVFDWVDGVVIMIICAVAAACAERERRREVQNANPQDMTETED